MPRSPKVVFIGIDGASLDVLLPLCEKGLTPGFAQCLSEGISGPLRSVIPTISATAWTSLYTGVNPGKHGIHDFVNRLPGRYGFKMATAADRRRKPIWSLLSEVDRRVCVIGGTLTYPPDPVNGQMLSGLGSPCKGGYPGHKSYAYPESFDQEITEKVGRFHIGPIVPQQHLSHKTRYADEIQREILRTVDYRNRLHEALLQKENYDFSFFFYGETDLASHLFWDEPAFLSKVYEAIDPFILRLCRTDDIQIFIASDHGFGPCRRLLNLRKWLVDQGDLRLSSSFKGKALAKVRALMGMSVNPLSDVSWPGTRAFVGGSSAGSLFLNRVGREPLGIVPSQEADAVCEEISRKLLRVQDPQTKRSVLEKIVFRKEAFSGETEEYAPDMVPIFQGGYGVGLRRRGRGDTDEGSLFSDSVHWTGDHVLDGIWMAKGDPFRHGGHLEGARIIDVAPTLLYLFGLPIPRDMDGQVLQGAFTETHLASSPIRLQESDPNPSSGLSTVVTDEDEKSMAEALRSLGYIE